jgi:hypothetical protein
MDLIVFQYLYGEFDAWPKNTEFFGDDRATADGSDVPLH